MRSFWAESTQLAKPHVKRGKNDAADAEALCEAMSRPTMRFVQVKTTDQQDRAGELSRRNQAAKRPALVLAAFENGAVDQVYD